MKFWKRATCIATCAMLASGSFVACDTDDTSKTDRMKNAQLSARNYVTAISSALETVKSFTVSGEIVLNEQTEYFDVDNERNDDVVESNQIVFSIDATVTQDGDDYAFAATLTNKEIEKDATVSYESVAEIIIKDGYQYYRDYYLKSTMTEEEKAAQIPLWTKEPFEVTEEYPFLDGGFINQLFNAKEVKEFGAQLMESAQTVLVDKFLANEVKNGEVTWSNNYAQDINALFAYIEGIDETQYTLGQLINTALAEIDPLLTVEGILASIKAYQTKTVGEVLTAIDAELAKKGTSLQGIYDSIVNSEVLAVVLQQAGVTIPAETLAAMKAFKVDMLKTQYGAMTVNEAMNLLLVELGVVDAPEEGEEPTDYFAELLNLLEALMGVPLDELDIEMPDVDGISFNHAIVSAGAKVDMTRKTLQSVFFGVDATVKIPVTHYEYDDAAGKNVETVVGNSVIDIDAKITLSQFKNVATAIQVPADDQVVGSPSYVEP